MQLMDSIVEHTSRSNYDLDYRVWVDSWLFHPVNSMIVMQKYSLLVIWKGRGEGQQDKRSELVD